MSEVRPYSLIQKSIQKPVPGSEPRAEAGSPSAFSRLLGEELSVPEDRLDPEQSKVQEDAEVGSEDVDLEYVAAELACRRDLLIPNEVEAADSPPVQTAYYLSHPRRSSASPMQAMRLGGAVKAAMQSRITMNRNTPPPEE